MADPRYESQPFQAARRGITIVQTIVMLSVIGGLLFVTMRVRNMGQPQPAAVQAAGAEATNGPAGSAAPDDLSASTK